MSLKKTLVDKGDGCACHVPEGQNYRAVMCEHCWGLNWATIEMRTVQAQYDKRMEKLL